MISLIVAAGLLFAAPISASAPEEAVRAASWPPAEKMPTVCPARHGPLSMVPTMTLMQRAAAERKILIGQIRNEPMAGLGPDVPPTREQRAALSRTQEALAAAGFTTTGGPGATLSCRRTECEPSWLFEMTPTRLGKRTRVYGTRIERPAEDERQSIVTVLDAGEPLSFEKNGLPKLLADTALLKKRGFGCSWILPPHEAEFKRKED